MSLTTHTLTLTVNDPDRSDDPTPLEGKWRIWLDVSVPGGHGHALALDDTGAGIGGEAPKDTVNGTAKFELPDTEQDGFEPQGAYYKAYFSSTNRSVRFPTERFLMDGDKNLADIMIVSREPVTPSLLEQVVAEAAAAEASRSAAAASATSAAGSATSASTSATTATTKAGEAATSATSAASSLAAVDPAVVAALESNLADATSDVRVALDEAYARVENDPINLATLAAANPASTHDQVLDLALAAVATAGGGRILGPPRVGGWSFASNHTYNLNNGHLTLDFAGAESTFTGTGVFMTITSATFGGVVDNAVITGKWHTTVADATLFRVKDVARTRFLGAWLQADTGTCIELRNELHYTEQTIIHGCTLYGKRLLVTNPASMTGNQTGGTESFARTRVVDCTTSAISGNGAADDYLFQLAGSFYHSTIMNIGGNLRSAGNVAYLNGSMIGTVLCNWGFERGNSSSRIFTAGPNFSTAAEPIIHSVEAIAPIVVMDASMPDMLRPFKTFGSVVIGKTPAGQGGLRLPNAQGVWARNGDDSGDVMMIRTNSDNTVEVGNGADHVTASSRLRVTVGVEYNSLSTAPSLPVAGTTYLANPVGWDPLSLGGTIPYLVRYSGGAYRSLDAAAPVALSVVQTGGDRTLPQSDATNYTDIPGLSWAAIPVGTWLLNGYLESEGTVTADLRLRFLPAGGLVYSGSWNPGGLISTVTTTSGSPNRAVSAWNSTIGTQIGLAGTGNPVALLPIGTLVVTTAGSMKMQATQGASEASDVKVRNGVLRLIKAA